MDNHQTFRQYMKPIYLTIIMLGFLSCGNPPNQQNVKHTNSEYQDELIRQGWTYKTLVDGEFSSEYGYQPIYGIQDNYFDIFMGNGSDIVVKIMDAKTDKCIRYVAVNESSSTTVSQIPQGIYYLKIAYGEDWAELETDSIVLGKFTRNVFYEKSVQQFDFGKKNSSQFVNYKLEINIQNDSGLNNFETKPISEEEFLE